MKISELDLATITCQTDWAVHFKIMDRYYVIVQSNTRDDRQFKIYLKPLRGGRGYWKLLCSLPGTMPRPEYCSRTKVYMQANIHKWMLDLVYAGVVTLVNDYAYPMKKQEILASLPAEDAIRVFGIRVIRNEVCGDCEVNKICPVAKLGLNAVLFCNYKTSPFVPFAPKILKQ